MFEEKLEEFEKEGIINTEFKYNLKKTTTSPGKNDELSVIEALKEILQNHTVEVRGNKEKADCFIDNVPVQIKNAGKAMLCSFNLRNIGPEEKMIGPYRNRSKEKDLEECIASIPEIDEINFNAISETNYYIKDNLYIDNYCKSYINRFPIMCIYNNENNTFVLYKNTNYINKKKFYCEIRSSGHNPHTKSKTKQFKFFPDNREYLIDKLKSYKVEEHYEISINELYKNTRKKRGNEVGELTSKIKLNILPKYFFVDRAMIGETDDTIRFSLENIGQLIPTIVFYIE